MFIFFAHNKISSDKKGQLAPVFIVILVVLIIMAMITVNLSKVSLIKTDSANAADAGALAGGSIMAGVFNNQASANSALYNAYIDFALTTIVMYLATVYLSYPEGPAGCAATVCCCPPCCRPSALCETGLTHTTTLIKIAMISFGFFHAYQLINYQNMRKNAAEGRKQAIETAYRYAFINSGIGNKLINGSPPLDAADKRGDDNNYSETFKEFVKSGPVTSGDYTWTDGQARLHKVHVEVDTEDVKSYELQYTFYPTIATEFLFIKAIGVIATTIMPLCSVCPCNAGTIEAELATLVTPILSWVLPALAPQPFTTEDSLGMKIMFPIAWVADINHNHLFTVTTWQEHGEQKQDFELWRATYPHIESKSVVSFAGSGSIFQTKPDPKKVFDASIIETD